MLQMSSSGTDSGYDGVSISGRDTRTNSAPFPARVPSITPHPPAPLAASASQPTQLHAWELSENRGFASDGPVRISTPIKTESTEGSVQMFHGIDKQTQAASEEIDYDELALDFVLT